MLVSGNETTVREENTSGLEMTRYRNKKKQKKRQEEERRIEIHVRGRRGGSQKCRVRFPLDPMKGNGRFCVLKRQESGRM